MKDNPFMGGKRTLFKASKFALEGIIYGYKNEQAIRHEIIFILVAIPVSIYLSETWIEMMALIFPCFLLLVVELLNSAIEAAIDRTSQEYHYLSKIAKDLGAAAVFICVIFVAVVWLSKIAFSIIPFI